MHPTCFFYPFSLIHTFSIAVLHIVPAHAYFYRNFRVVRTAHWHTVWTLIRALIWEMKLLNPSNILVSNIGKFPKRFYLVGQLLSICCLITYFWPETCWPAFSFRLLTSVKGRLLSLNVKVCIRLASDWMVKLSSCRLHINSSALITYKRHKSSLMICRCSCFCILGFGSKSRTQTTLVSSGLEYLSLSRSDEATTKKQERLLLKEAVR